MNYISGFDTLRAFSIILVLMGHLGLYHWLPEHEFILTRVWLLISGTTGVQIFFTISGYLITTLLINEKLKKGKINFKNFFARRFLRLLPPLIVFFLAVGILMYFEMIQSTRLGFLFSLTYVYNFAPRYYYTNELGHTWSLAVEEQFYVTWPLILNFVKQKITLYIIIGLVITLCLVAFYVFPQLPFSQNYYLERWFIPAVAPIMTGSFFALLNSKKEEKWRIIFHKNTLVLLLSFTIFVFPLYTPILLLPITPLVQSIGISIFLIWLLYNQENKFMPIWNNYLFRYIGKISYGLYVYQGLFLTTGPTGKLSIQQFPLNILLTFVVAIISYHFIEQPALRLKSRFT